MAEPSPLAPAIGEPSLFGSTAAFGELASESFELWRRGCEAWVAYGARIAKQPDPMGWLAANQALMADGLELCQQAAATRLRSAGSCPPLLNDA